jgi:hypothetical protein
MSADREIDTHERALAVALGQRLANVALRLQA